MKVRNALLIIVVAVVLAAGLGLGLARSGNPSASGADETDLVAQYLYMWNGMRLVAASARSVDWNGPLKSKPRMLSPKRACPSR